MAKTGKKNANVPNLRFPGFEGEWEKKRLDEFIDVISGIPLQSEEISEDQSEVPILRGINITEGFIRHNKDIDRYYSKSITTKTDKYLLKENDLVIGMDGSKVGKNVALIPKFDVGSILIQRVARIRALDNANIHYIYQRIFSNEFQKYVDVVNTSSGIPHISLQQIKDFDTGLPTSLKEQAKIASFLTLIDERISTQNKIIEELKFLKTVTSQKLFSRKLRFKNDDGKEFSNWGIKKLEEISEKKSSNISANKIEDNCGEYLIYGASGILKKVNFYEEENDYVSIVKDGAGVGRLFYCKGKSSVLGTMDMLKPKSITNAYFLYCLLDTIDFTKYVTGSTIPHIYYKDYANENIELPCFEEQLKISNILFLINNKIELEIKVLHQLEKQKKSLLRDLFI